MTVSIHRVNFCALSQSRITRSRACCSWKTNGNAQGLWMRRRVWQASLPWPHKELEFYTQRASLHAPQGTSSRNAYRRKILQQLFKHEGQLRHIAIRYQLHLTPHVNRSARQLNVYHLVTCCRLQYQLSEPWTQLAAKWT
jgi:hypothetical protein